MNSKLAKWLGIGAALVTIVGFVFSYVDTISQKTELRTKVEDLQVELEKAKRSRPESENELHITTSELSMIAENYFGSNLSKNQVISRIKELVRKADELETLENNFYFKLLKLELLIPKYGRYIDTRIAIDSNDKKEAYERIQSILQDIGVYKGSINGDQQATYDALAKFQKKHNSRAGKDILIPEDFGIFGYGTLEAVRSTYRLSKN